MKHQTLATKEELSKGISADKQLTTLDTKVATNAVCATDPEVKLTYKKAEENKTEAIKDFAHNLPVAVRTESDAEFCFSNGLMFVLAWNAHGGMIKKMQTLKKKQDTKIEEAKMLERKVKKKSKK